MKVEFSPQIYEKYSNLKFHENPSYGNRQTDIVRLTVTFRNLRTCLKSTDLVQTDDDQPAGCHSNPERWEQEVMATVFTIGGQGLVRQDLVTSSDIINQLTCTVTIITFGRPWSTV